MPAISVRYLDADLDSWRLVEFFETDGMCEDWCKSPPIELIDNTLVRWGCHFGIVKNNQVHFTGGLNEFYTGKAQDPVEAWLTIDAPLEMIFYAQTCTVPNDLIVSVWIEWLKAVTDRYGDYGLIAIVAKLDATHRGDQNYDWIYTSAFNQVRDSNAPNFVAVYLFFEILLEGFGVMEDFTIACHAALMGVLEGENPTSEAISIMSEIVRRKIPVLTLIECSAGL